MRLKNTLIVVEDIERSKAFYRELFGLSVVTDFGENVILTEGLVLQERKTWERFTGKKAVYGGCDAELYFEENDMDGFLARLQKQEPPVSYVNESMEHDWGQRVVRLYDPDRHVIEVGESMNFVARRFLNMGMTAEQTAEKHSFRLSRSGRWQEERTVSGEAVVHEVRRKGRIK